LRVSGSLKPERSDQMHSKNTDALGFEPGFWGTDPPSALMDAT